VTDPKPGQYFQCPFCPRRELVSIEDPDASFSEVLGHITMRHHDEDQSPSVLWPKIEVADG
jgi:hypothetical protein